MSILKEFKEFAVKGNAVELAIGVAVGAAFGAITNSLVSDIINPLTTLFTGGVDFSKANLVLLEATDSAAAVTLNYGLFLNTIINFIIISFFLFLVVKGMNHLRREMRKNKRGEDKSKPSPPADVQLLTEIRDLLRDSSAK